MMTKVLVLDQSYQPHRIVTWQRAVCLLYDDKAEMVENVEGETLKSPSLEMEMPSVIRLLTRPRTRKQSIKFSRVNVMTRDGYRCQYCNARKPMHKLNYDHVLPRSRGGRTSWENVVTACYPCNMKKGDRTPVEAGMALLKTPTKPAWLPVTSARFDMSKVPSKWYPYLGWQESANDAEEVA